MSWLFSIGAKLKIWGGIALAVLVAIGVAFLRGRQAGKEIIRQEQERARAKAIQARKEIEDEVDQLGPADVDREFNRWVRNDDR